MAPGSLEATRVAGSSTESPGTPIRRALAVIAAMSFLALAGVLPARAGAASGCGVGNGLGSFSAGNQPGACWRPYSDASPFNRKIPFGVPVQPDSASKVSELLAGGPVGHLVFGDGQRDGGVPIYWSQPSDPVYTLHCIKPWSDCALEGLQIHVPAQATPTGGFATDAFDHDAHMTVVDQQSGWEYDMWNVWSKTGSTINFGWGGKTRIDGDGLGSAAVASDYGSIAGPIRPEELVAGRINHALTMVVPCTDTYVYPAAATGAECEKSGLPASLSIPMGSHFQLKMSRGAIRSLNVPAWKKTILTALSTYGAYVSDTSEAADQWGFEKIAPEGYTSFGQPDPWVQFAGSLGVQPEDYNSNGQLEYWLDLAPGVPWKRLRIVSICAAEGTCPVVDRSKLRRQRAARCRRSLARWNRRRDHADPSADRKRVRWSRRCRRLARSA